jgi:hypothetical protein
MEPSRGGGLPTQHRWRSNTSGRETWHKSSSIIDDTTLLNDIFTLIDVANADDAAVVMDGPGTGLAGGSSGGWGKGSGGGGGIVQAISEFQKKT